MAKALCANCGGNTDCTMHSRVSSRDIDGKKIIFHEKYVTCNKCDSEVTVACIDVENEREFESVCNGLKGCGLL